MSVNDAEASADRPTREISLTVNGETVTAEVEPRLKLSDFLREHLELRAVRVGCEHGVCGACTVDFDGTAAKSCMLYAVQADGKSVTTVEGLSEDGDLHPIQEAFHEEHALQCGFCTSGFVMSARELIADNPDPSRAEIEAGLADNICRCTGYQNIYEAVERAADELADATERVSDTTADTGGEAGARTAADEPADDAGGTGED
jgi:carbon-monoxide dehydrogenase small subunit